MNLQPVFARIMKVDERTRMVTGRACQEMVDRDNEVLDYNSSKPNFMKWSAEVSQDTGNKSMGNVRAMHGNVAAGILTDIRFLDAEKAIDVDAHIVDDNEWKKVQAGVYSGFSIGGRYAKKWSEIMDGKVVVKYTAVPSELSLVDRPCVPAAKFETISEKGFDFIKRDGSVEKRDFTFLHEIKFNGGKFEVVQKGGPGSGPQGGGGHTAEEARGKAADHAKMERLHTQASQRSSTPELSSAHAKAAAAHGKASDAYSQAAEHLGAGLSSGQDHFSDAAKLGAKANAKTAPLRN
jgi:hypothetical protein